MAEMITFNDIVVVCLLPMRLALWFLDVNSPR